MPNTSKDTIPPSLQQLSTKKVIQYGLFNLMTKAGLSTKDQKVMLGHNAIKPILSKFFQAVIDDDRDMVTEILTSNPELLVLQPEHLEIESQYTWQRLKAEPPLVMALQRNQVEMVKILLPFFEKLEGGIEEALRQWAIAETEMAEAKKKSRDFDFKSLIKVIVEDMFPNGTDIKATLSKKTKQALATFRATVLPKHAVALSDYYDIEELLKAAFKAYDEYFDTFNGHKAWNRRSVYCVKVIGFIQSLLSPEDAKVLCQGLYNVVERSEQIGERAASLKLLDNVLFYRRRGLLVGLGVEYMVGVAGARRHGASSRRTWSDYVEQKRQKLNHEKPLSQPCEPASSPMNGSIL